MVGRRMEYKTGDVYVVRFHPSFGSELKRFRPAVVVSGTVSKIDSRFSLIAPLSTNVSGFNKKYEMLVKDGGFLGKESVALLWYVRTVDVGRMEKKIGKLSEQEVKKMKMILKRFFV
jgi:mRNA interferase MazF